ncbi:DUF2929 domain-containing protein [Pueribacillus theae]|uniref:DUF2929 domain-containing protein n=1 Tax=Pueribacillus theae TaxID=2171751 RepID=A0A2U1K5F2_9BACI|nr:YjzD family protein [Pueribacillus theae]PWA12737.1 DUF2929 domain-containing protein [Pueribacillus theae]
MRFIMTFIVSFLLIQMVYYVLGNMNSVTYSFANATIMSIIFGILAIVIGESTVSEPDV